MPYLIFLFLFLSLFNVFGQSATSPYVPTLPPMQREEISKPQPEEENNTSKNENKTLSLKEIAEVDFVTEGGNNPGRLIVQGFHNFRIEIFVDGLPYPRDASGSYNLWALQTLQIERYEIKQGTKGFVQLHLYTKKEGSPFFINYSNTALLPASHILSFFSGQNLAVGGFYKLTHKDSLNFQLNGLYQFNRYYSPSFRQEIAENRGFFAGNLNYDHQFENYILVAKVASSFNKTQEVPENNEYLGVTPVNFNSQEAGISFNSTNQNVILENFITFSRTAYSLSLTDYDYLAKADLYQVNNHHKQGWVLSQNWHLAYSLDTAYSHYLYKDNNDKTAPDSFISLVSPGIEVGFQPETGWQILATLGYPLQFSKKENDTHLVHNFVGTAQVAYQAKVLKPSIEGGFVRRDPNALELYYPMVNNPNLKSEYFAYGKAGLEAQTNQLEMQATFQAGYLINTILTGQTPVNSNEKLYRLHSNFNLKYRPVKPLTLKAGFASTHTFTLQNHPYDDLIPKFTASLGLTYQPIEPLSLTTHLKTLFYDPYQTGYPHYTLQPTLHIKYQQNRHLSYYVEGQYTATPHFQPLTPYGSNPIATLTLGVNYAY